MVVRVGWMSAYVRILGYLGFLLLLLMACLLSVEYVLRLSYPERVRGGALLYRSDPQALMTFRENLATSRLVYSYDSPRRIPFTTNQFGFRDDISNYNDRPRIVVLGDSNVAGLFVDHKSTLTERLENYLDNKFHVLNLGVPGYGPDQSFLLLKKHFDKFKPTVVVLHVFADNDFGDLLGNGLLSLPS